jgi:hypothetical protein
MVRLLFACTLTRMCNLSRTPCGVYEGEQWRGVTLLVIGEVLALEHLKLPSYSTREMMQTEE